VDDGASASGSGSDSGSDGDDSDAVWESEDDSEIDDDSDGSDGSSNHTSDVEPSGADAGLPDAGAMREVCGADAARPDALPDAGATCEAGARNGDVRLVQPPPLAPRRAGAVDEVRRATAAGRAVAKLAYSSAPPYKYDPEANETSYVKDHLRRTLSLLALHEKKHRVGGLVVLKTLFRVEMATKAVKDTLTPNSQRRCISLDEALVTEL
jgi:hypothetical protein